MKQFFLVFFTLFMSLSYADEVKIELNPTKPVVGEVFQAVFHVFTNLNEEPIINFSPYKIEVVGKNNFGIKTSTTWINGKFSTTREMTIVYDLAASEAGSAGIRDITVTLGSKVLRHPSLTFNVLKEPEVAPDVFVMADVPKKSVFIGEGIVVRYYLYSKVPVQNLDIKKYPKLMSFLKRFLQEPERSERVTVDGQLYIRTQIYGAKLFPEKVGELKIDPLQLSATVITGRSNDPFGNFGIGRETRQKTVSSESVKVEVRPLPEEGRGPNFTGLIGKHEFDLQLNGQRFIVNEPLELKLTVSGGGALENMEAPTVLKHPDIEEFESNGDLKIQNADQATKIFEYTFLPKAPLTLPAATIPLTYFDPDTMRYVAVNLSLGEIVVGGTAQASNKKEDRKTEKEEKKDSPQKILERPLTLAGPVFTKLSSWRDYIGGVNLVLASLALLLALSFFFNKISLPQFAKSNIPKTFKKGKFQTSEFAKWLEPLIASTGKSPLRVIKESDLSEKTKIYFEALIKETDAKQFSYLKGTPRFEYQASSFKELDDYIKSVKNENTQQPS